MVKKKDLIHFIAPIPKGKFFFTKFELPNLGCSLSVSGAYRSVFIHFVFNMSYQYSFLIQKYMTTIWFINKFEGVCGSKTSVQRLRSHPSFSAFMSRWSLPVYFQIRFVDLFIRLGDMSV